MTESRNEELSRFAELLIKSVRDPAIEACDRLAAGKMRGPNGNRWGTLLTDDQARRSIRELIPDIVDQTIFEFLDAADNAQLPVAWQCKDGSFCLLDDLGQGEMCGWLMGSPGWRHEYSSKRFFDPLANLKPEPDKTKEN